MAESTKRKKIACLLGEGFEDSEFRVPYDRLRDAGFNVEIIGTEAGQQLAGYKKRETATTDLGIDDAEAESYDGLLIPGGQSPDHLRVDRRFVDFVKDFDATGRPLAAVCHGPQLLLSAELQRGRTLTAWSTVQGSAAGRREREGRRSGRRSQLDHEPHLGAPRVTLSIG